MASFPPALLVCPWSFHRPYRPKWGGVICQSLGPGHLNIHTSFCHVWPAPSPGSLTSSPAEVTSSPGPVLTPCPHAWILFEGNCYLVWNPLYGVGNLLTARATCKELHPSADLASSNSENDFISSLYNFPMWLGGTKGHTED